MHQQTASEPRCSVEFAYRAQVARSEHLDELADYYAMVADLSAVIEELYDREIRRMN